MYKIFEDNVFIHALSSKTPQMHTSQGDVTGIKIFILSANYSVLSNESQYKRSTLFVYALFFIKHFIKSLLCFKFTYS